MSSLSFFPHHFRNRAFPAGSLGSRHRPRAGAVGCRCLVAFVLLAALPAPAQEALRNSLAGDAAAEARKIRLESLPYTVKSGDFRLLVVPSLGLDWNDNVNISRTNAQQDFILSPQMQLDASYPITQNNVLSLNVGVGYNKYFDHEQYSAWFMQSGTELSFDIYAKDFWFNLHDRVNYVQDTSQQAALAGTATYATLNNTAGFSVTWDLNKATLSAGYDHENVITPSSQQSTPSSQQSSGSQDRATEMIFARAGLEVYPGTIAGIEGTGAFTTYDQMVLNDNNSYSAGVYADWQPGKAFRVQPRVGYSITKIQHTSQTIQTADMNSWYFDLNMTHQVTDAISYSLDAGHEVQLGIQSDVMEDWYVRPGINWNIIKNVGLNTSFSYEHGNQGAGNVAGNLTENFDWFTTEVGASYAILKKLSLGLNYRLTLRSSNNADREYMQNFVGLSLTYQP